MPPPQLSPDLLPIIPGHDHDHASAAPSADKNKEAENQPSNTAVM